MVSNDDDDLGVDEERNAGQLGLAEERNCVGENMKMLGERYEASSSCICLFAITIN